MNAKPPTVLDTVVDKMAPDLGFSNANDVLDKQVRTILTVHGGNELILSLLRNLPDYPKDVRSKLSQVATRMLDIQLEREPFNPIMAGASRVRVADNGRVYREDEL